MKTAEEILLEFERVGYMPDEDFISVNNAIKAINEARKEAIEECADIFFNPDNQNSIELAKQLKYLINKLQ